MHPLSTPRFTILDAMALTAAVGVGLALARFSMKGEPLWLYPLWAIARGSWAVALPVTWMVPTRRLIGRQPARRRRFRPPGVAACVAVVMASALMFLFRSSDLFSHLPGIGWAYLGSWRGALQRVLDPMPLAAAVGATWTVQALDRRWRPEPSWIDRLGRALGVFWLAAGLAYSLLMINSHFHLLRNVTVKT